MPAVAMRERRKCPRTRIDIDVVLSCKSSAERHTVAVHDLSLTGMAIYPGVLKFNLNDSLCLCLSPGNDQCSMDHVIEATVVHLYGDMVGIRFDTVGIHILKDIQQLLHKKRVV